MHYTPDVCYCLNREVVGQKTKTTIHEIRNIYNAKIDQLADDLAAKQQKMLYLLELLAHKDNTIEELLLQNRQMSKQLQSSRDDLKDAESRVNQLLSRLSLFEVEREELANKLGDRIIELQKEINQVKNSDVISNMSSMRGQESSHYSLEISELFQKHPQEIMKFIHSVEGERPTDDKELGNMTCLLISRDGNSVDKYVEVNRSFLKRKIKEQEKRFRFVLIQKPERNM